MNSEINMNPWIWICVFPWTHEFYICQLDEPMNFISGKSMNPWIWKLTMLWTHEYEYQIPYELLNMNMDTLLCELLKVHTAHEILWTMPWTPWIVMRDIFPATPTNVGINMFGFWNENFRVGWDRRSIKRCFQFFHFKIYIKHYTHIN